MHTTRSEYPVNKKEYKYIIYSLIKHQFCFYSMKKLWLHMRGGGIFYSLEYISEVTGKHSTVSNLNASDVSCFVYEVT